MAIALVLTVSAFLGIRAVQRGNQLWSDLRATERDFQVPPNFSIVKRFEGGTNTCLIPMVECSRPRISLMFDVAGATEEQACEAMVHGLSEPRRESLEDGCLYVSRMSVRERQVFVLVFSYTRDRRCGESGRYDFQERRTVCAEVDFSAVEK